MKKKKRYLICLICNILMGLALSILEKMQFGTDPVTMFNLWVSRYLNISLGTWQALASLCILLFVLIIDRKKIGFGTVSNMLVVGYSFDFFTWVINQTNLLEVYSGFLARVTLTILFLFLFILSAALYNCLDIGVGAFDAIPQVISSKTNIELKDIRIIYDLFLFAFGFLFGSTYGIVSIFMVFGLGYAIGLIKTKMGDFVKET